MLDAWVGDNGRVPLEKLAQPVLEASMLAAKASPEAKVAALEWLRAVTEGGKADRCVGTAFRAAVLGAVDKSAEVRAAGTSLAKQLLEVRQVLSMKPTHRNSPGQTPAKQLYGCKSLNLARMPCPKCKFFLRSNSPICYLRWCSVWVIVHHSLLERLCVWQRGFTGL